MYDVFLTERLAQLRNKKGVSARDMSLSLGQSESYINMIENKKNMPSMALFFIICEYLNVTPHEFFESDNKNPEKLSEIISDLKQLDDNALLSIGDVIKGLAKK